MARSYLPRSRASTRQSSVARLTAMAVLLGGAVSTATAQQTGRGGEGDSDGPEDTEWGLGLGVMVKQDAYKGIKRDTQVLPVLRFENEYVEIFGPGIELKLPSLRLGERARMKFGLVGEYDFSGYEAKDSPILAGMAERKGGLWLGAKAEWENDLLDVTAEWTAASGSSKGRKFSLGLKKEWHLGQHTMVMPYLTAHRLDKKYVDYYYGVRAAEATAGRAAYVGKGAMNLEVGMRTMYRFDEHHSVLLDLSMTRLAKHIKASPLVGRSSSKQLILGYVYSF
ncbi:MipA/OmpV family protein [Roseateles asaccharophilus]|uniref:Outer membrane protein n=1 Tax=Roseateles asaccharophilus TaxID=582607 RepID=A0ABU2A3X5_9BURK|nr:MipA/OmpV family protein [Roseateles asaccharophilus]MDR7331896.1 outer membrane protein [Roseateles asaccharophilus]